MSKTNPVAGADYLVALEAPESLAGATITIERRTNFGIIEEGIAPTLVDTTNNIIYYEIPSSDSINGGEWRVWAKVIKSGKIKFTSPVVKVYFDEKGKI